MRERIESQKPKSVFSNVGATTSQATATIARTQQMMEKVLVVHGANQRYFDLAGKDVGSVRKSLREAFNIPGDAEARVDGKEVNDEFVLDNGQHVEFTRKSGSKGIS